MLVSIFLALFLPCAGMSVIFLVYICLLCYSARTSNDEQQFRAPVKPFQNRGLSASDLQKLPKVTGKDLVLGTDCAICLDEIESEQPARMVPGCNHGFHLECADAWLSKNSICPVCRAKIGPELFNPSQISPC
ncbi:E3 ubiquitin-protein ligase ATL23 [Salvia miltiorrhiza]|uniref:E3 ubiquitin-protein ligase ATL23 n=1 Tax=Salvia miltiorrhiza TaxID=226208 RepID=UPI0025AD7E71|nr:E3 ubiquitin-protein ligase ATL23 [Salvia miltiorrhiza]